MALQTGDTLLRVLGHLPRVHVGLLHMAEVSTELWLFVIVPQRLSSGYSGSGYGNGHRWYPYHCRYPYHGKATIQFVHQHFEYVPHDLYQGILQNL